MYRAFLAIMLAMVATVAMAADTKRDGSYGTETEIGVGLRLSTAGLLERRELRGGAIVRGAIRNTIGAIEAGRSDLDRITGRAIRRTIGTLERIDRGVLLGRSSAAGAIHHRGRWQAGFRRLGHRTGDLRGRIGGRFRWHADTTRLDH